MASSIELLLLAQASVTDTQVLAGDTLVNSVTMATLLTAPVAGGGGGYLLRAFIGCLAHASAGTPQLRLTGGSGATVSQTGYGLYAIGGGVDPAPTWATTTGGTWSGPTMAGASTQYLLIIEGTISFTAGGTLSLQAATSVGADTWTAQAGSKFSLVPIP